MRYWFILFFAILATYEANAAEENWLTIALKRNLSTDQYIATDYVRRDSGPLFSERFRDLYRISYGKKWEQFHLVLGAAFADFESSFNEYRLFQQAIFDFENNSFDLSGLARLGLEERRFSFDENTYLRSRIKLSLMPLHSRRIGPIFYNEAFFGFSGKDRFYDGLNENRFGYGVRSSVGGIESSVIWVNTQTKSSTGTIKDVHWLQIQINHSF